MITTSNKLLLSSCNDVVNFTLLELGLDINFDCGINNNFNATIYYC